MTFSILIKPGELNHLHASLYLLKIPVVWSSTKISQIPSHCDLCEAKYGCSATFLKIILLNWSQYARDNSEPLHSWKFGWWGWGQLSLLNFSQHWNTHFKWFQYLELLCNHPHQSYFHMLHVQLCCEMYSCIKSRHLKSLCFPYQQSITIYHKLLG